MSCNWPLVKLADVACIITTKIDANQITKDCYISTENMQPYKGGVSSADSLPSAAKFNSFRVGDTLFSNIRTYFEKVWLASFSGGASADVLIFRTKDESVLLSEYLYHFLSSPEFIEFTVRTSKGAKMPRGDKGAMMDFEFKLPPVEIQKIIACSLQGLERKVRLNSQTNQTLEQMAQAIFKSWFVDFDPVKAKINGEQPEGMDAATASLFPEKLVESELGLIPDGWEAKQLKDILELAYGKALKKTDRVEGDVPVYGSGGLTGYHNQNLVEGPGIIVGRKGTVGSVYWEPKAFYPIDTVFYVKPKAGYSLNYCYLILQNLGLKNMNTDAAVPGLNRNNAYRLEVVTPSQGVLNKFESLMSAFQSKIDGNNAENSSLETLRDTLLPKLLSGEIELGTSEELVEAI
ncbi:restriction endonuclease subunit S [Vibrio metschnikovii]|nr:restriction endonuclease subunit S [Vibrio metschnikovii]